MDQQETPHQGEQSKGTDYGLGSVPEEVKIRAHQEANRLFAFLGIAGILLFGGCVTYYSMNPSSTTQSAHWPIAGAEGILRVRDKGDVLCTSDLDTFKRWMNAAAAKDEAGMREVSDGTNVFVLPDGTKVKYLEGDGFANAIRVRVLDGARAGDAVWTSFNGFQESKP